MQTDTQNIIVTIVTTGIVRIEKQNKICVFFIFQRNVHNLAEKYDFFTKYTCGDSDVGPSKLVTATML